MRKRRQREELGRLADEIEGEMRRGGIWVPNPPAEEDVVAGGAFGQASTSFETWLQVVFVTRLRQVAAGAIDVPGSSQVGVMAAREWDTAGFDTARLQSLLSEVDDVVARG